MEVEIDEHRFGGKQLDLQVVGDFHGADGLVGRHLSDAETWQKEGQEADEKTRMRLHE